MLNTAGTGSGVSRSMRMLPIAVVTLLSALCGCGDDARPVDSVDVGPGQFPTMRTLRVNTAITDSGILRYRIITPVWFVYDEAEEPYWRFPDGLHIEKYNDAGLTDATIDADSAYYNMRRDVWRLDGYVCITSDDSTLFLTEQLFWDKLNHKVYTDSFIHIERPDRIIEGYGFESNDRMTDYRVLRTSGIFPANRFRQGVSERDDSVAEMINPDSTAVFDPLKAAQDDPEDARRTDKAFNGVPTDTLKMQTAPGRTDAMRRRPRRPINKPDNL